MKVDEVEASGLGVGGPVEQRLQAAEELCRGLRRRVEALEREREQLRARLEAILSLLDGVGRP